MPVQIEGYTFTSNHKAVIDAARGVIPKDQWKCLPNVAKMLLVIVVVRRNARRYCGSGGFLTLTFSDLLKVQKLVTANHQVKAVRDVMRYRKLYATNGKPGRKNRLKLLVNPDVQACLDDLARYDQSKLLC